MTDERIDALLRRLDVPSDPDPEFVRSTYAALRPRARAARVDDASRIGRLRRDLRLVLAGASWPSTARPVGMVGLVVLLVLRPGDTGGARRRGCAEPGPARPGCSSSTDPATAAVVQRGGRPERASRPGGRPERGRRSTEDARVDRHREHDHAPLRTHGHAAPRWTGARGGWSDRNDGQLPLPSCTTR